MTRALNLYKRHSMEALTAMQQAICDDPACRNPEKGSIWIYTPAARKKLADIAWAIRYHMEDRQAAAASMARDLEAPPMGREGR